LQVNGGAERLVLSVANGLDDFNLIVARIHSELLLRNFSDAAKVEVISKYNFLPRQLQALVTFRGSIPEISNADTVIYSGIYAPLAVRNQLCGQKICYCHTEPRFATDRQEEYLEKFPRILRPGVRFGVAKYRNAYFNSLKEMDLVLCNSEHVKKRLFHWGVRAEVLYPPIDLQKFRWISEGDYYLSVARVEANKRIDRIVRAFLQMPDKKLIVASGGSALSEVQELAGAAPNITFTDWVDDTQLAALVGNARACIYIPRDEDFGMSVVESMAAGKPVIGVSEGGLKETIIHGKTGLLMPADPSVEDIVSAVNAMSPSLAHSMRDEAMRRAQFFDEHRFLSELSRICG
jgi:glycosyltransferase involved in cell wall biosynthesis